MKRWGIFLLLFLFVASRVSAVTVSFSTPSGSIDQAQELSLDIFLSCTNCGDSYFRGVFFETSDNYFGLTQNNSGEWIGTSSDRTKYYKVAKDEIKDSSWSGKLKVRVDADNSYYKGPGNYSLKVGRYTASSGSSATWSDVNYLTITGPTPTPTPFPTSTQTPTPTPTSTPVPTSTQTPIPTPTKTPTQAPTKSSTPTLALFPTGNVLAGSTVAGSTLGILSINNDAQEVSPSTQQKNGLKPLIIAFLFIGAGLALIALILVWQKRNLVKHVY